MHDEILRLDNYLHPSLCKRLRAVYDEGLAARRFKPRGGMTTDIALHQVVAGKPHLNCCGLPPVSLKGLRDALALRLADFYGLGELVADYTAYTRAYLGGAHTLHADAVNLDGSPNHTPWRVASAMLYLNDGDKDFAGGVIEFPKRDLAVVPKPGHLVAFTCGLDNQHLVTPVVTGVRDAIAFYFTQDARHREHWPD